jgi:Ca-activated chloride channel homolog
MERRSAIRLMVASAVAHFSKLFAGSPTQDSTGFVIHSDVRLVLLDVAVKDRNGGLVGDLKKDNFTVLENGHPQAITVFADEDLPVTVGLLVDESRSMLPKRNEVLMAAGDFLRTCNPQDEIFVLNFNDDVRRGLPAATLFSDDLDQLRKALDRGVPEGMTAMNDAVVVGLEQLEEGRRDKKALVLISDGGDNASEHTRAEMFDMVQRSPATIYTLALVDPTDRDFNPHILRNLSNLSGGEAYFVEDLDQLKPIFESIGKEIRKRYTLGYPPPPGKPGVLRHIQVRVSAAGHPGLVARTRTAYRYEVAPDGTSK